jgi:methyl-accepting chemotaxis protein
MMKDVKIATKLYVGFATILLIMIAVGVLSRASLSEVTQATTTIGEVRAPSMRYLQDMAIGQLRIGSGIRGLINRRMMDAKTRQENYNDVTKGFEILNVARNRYEAQLHTPEESRIWQALVPVFGTWKREIDAIVELSREKDQLISQGVTLDDPRVTQIDARAFEQTLRARDARFESGRLLDELTTLNAELGTKSVSEAAAAASQGNSRISLTILAGVLFGIVVALGISRSVASALGALHGESLRLTQAAIEGDLSTRGNLMGVPTEFRGIVQGINDTLDAVIEPLNVAADYVDKLSKGQLPPRLTREYRGDFNTIKNNLNQCIDAIERLITDAAQLSQSAVAGKLSARADVHLHQGDYRKIVGGFNDTLDAVIGPLNVAAECVDKISKGNIPPKITASYQGDFNTIKDNLNRCIDAVNLLVSDAQLLAKSAVEGRLSTRADASRHEGDFKRVVTGVNDTLDAVIGPLNAAANCINRISRGDVPPRITESYQGDFNTLKDSLNNCIDAINRLIEDTKHLSQAAAAGKLGTRADASAHQGDFRTIVTGINATLDAVIEPLTIAATCVDRISKGDIPPKITQNFAGDFNTIKNNLNECIDAINRLTHDTQALSESAILGKLDTRADANAHFGDFKRIVEGINHTLDAIIGPVMEATGVLESLAQYDLRTRVTGDYQGDHARIKNALNGTAQALHDALAQVALAVEQVAEASKQIAASSQSVAQGASEQASSLEETSSSLEEMASMTKQNADNTIQARSLAQTTKEAAESGGRSMVKMTDAMQKIRSAAEGTAQIIKDINDIAFQTNLLALNAAVEAARAGEAGRGFAVVAEEVRNLALRSKEAAKKTEDLIQMSVGNAENGRVITDEVAKSLGEIVTAAGKVNDIIGEIAVASQEQSRGIEQVNTAVSEMDKVVQVAAANAEESSSASEELSGQSEELAGLVARFKLDRQQMRSTEKRTLGPESSKLGGHAPQRRVMPKAAPRRAAPGTNGSRASSFEEELMPLHSDVTFREF